MLRDSTPRWLARSWKIFARLLDPWARPSYAQEGEDLVLERIFGLKADGFYVDVGAHHPIRFSNTLLLHEKGWSGINIDPNPDSIRLFTKHRPSDINLELGVSDSEGTLAYYKFNEPALNTFDKILADERVAIPPYRLVGIVEIPVMQLSRILEKSLPVGTVIDLLSIDAEGFDLKVLESNDWEKFRPKIVAVESLGTGLDKLFSSPQYAYLRENNYIPLAMTYSTVFYEDTKS